MVGLFMTTASGRSQLPALVPFGHGGKLISGAWFFQAVSAGPTVNTALAQPTFYEQCSRASDIPVAPPKEIGIPFQNPASQGSAMNGTSLL